VPVGHTTHRLDNLSHGEQPVGALLRSPSTSPLGHLVSGEIRQPLVEGAEESLDVRLPIWVVLLRWVDFDGERASDPAHMRRHEVGTVVRSQDVGEPTDLHTIEIAATNCHR
jgi:hypothetical protein